MPTAASPAARPSLTYEREENESLASSDRRPVDSGWRGGSLAILAIRLPAYWWALDLLVTAVKTSTRGLASSGIEIPLELIMSSTLTFPP